MEEHWYGNPKVSGSSPSSVKFSLPIFQLRWKSTGTVIQRSRVRVPVQSSFLCQFFKSEHLLLVSNCPMSWESLSIRQEAHCKIKALSKLRHYGTEKKKIFFTLKLGFSFFVLWHVTRLYRFKILCQKLRTNF